MSQDERLIDVWMDFLPNQPNTPEGRNTLERFLRQRVEKQLESAVDRLFQLPPVMVQASGEYISLLAEAREVYTHAHFYACVAMCGIVGERILKDVMRAGLRVVINETIVVPSESALDQLEHVDASAIARFLARAGLITEEGGKAADKLQRLRNAYAHARGVDAQGDALKAITHLHDLIEGSVSVFKTFEIKDGKLVRKSTPEVM